MADLSVLFIGLGSIGTRHLKNLVSVAAARGLKVSIDALRHNIKSDLPADTAALIGRQFESVEQLGKYDFIFICNPSQLHYETLCAVKGKGRFFFVEKPVFISPLSKEKLKDFSDEKKFYVACPIRHMKIMSEIRKIIAENKIYSAQAMCSSYLPEWRPGQDYRKLYSAKKESGGVKLDLIHEFDYLISLFGFPSKAALFENKVSDLEIECPDVVSFIGSYPDKTVELHLDYFGRSVQRKIDLFTKDDVIHCDLANSEITYLRKKETVSFQEERNDYYVREMNYFFDFALSGKDNINSVLFANDVLDFVVNGGCR
ncbi:MAG: Gfo/Idh/MocA family oxidoreductase [Alphaproteobacteria bacterium]|nr:Gfo/Idh/MocA family oxidoreductase [Alphaproteobacteria bacterium]